MTDTDLCKLFFRQLTIDDKASIEQIRKINGHTSSSHAFNSLFLWQNDMKLSICIRDDAFIVKYGGRGENAFFFPCGSLDGKLALLKEIIELPSLSLHYIREEDKEMLSTNFADQFNFDETRGDSEYMYNLKDQLEMNGKPFKNARSKIHKVINSAKWTVKAIDKTNVEKARKVILDWQGSDGSVGDKPVALLALDNIEALDLIGVIIESLDGEPMAVALGGMIYDDIFDLHVTKALDRSLNCLIRFEICKMIPSNVTWLNQEEDLNIQGIRENKLEAHPHHISILWRGISKHLSK